ncbi:jg12392 [Pararge aegeria aegeria]|uniref:Jg12392 protein n=1 Tax=Pararge aegeria aegeria TaxID=348720 RepID=A0A8S4SC81_9NEOP|nr:jg12392 [Pararge aegeria aegeria]
MEGRLIVFILFLYSQQCSSERFLLCDDTTRIRKDCSVQIWGDESSDDTTSCDVEFVPRNSSDCEASFSRIPAISSSRLGNISIMPFLMNVKCDDCSPYHHVVPNIVFRDIKWKKLKFRIEQRNTYPTKRHCRNLAISDNVTIYEHSVLHYDCYLSLTDGSLRNTPTHVLDVEATDGTTVDGWQFLFFIPPTQVLIDSNYFTSNVLNVYHKMEKMGKVCELATFRGCEMRRARSVFTFLDTHSSKIPQCLKTKVFEQCVLPVMTYGSRDMVANYGPHKKAQSHSASDGESYVRSVST